MGVRGGSAGGWNMPATCSSGRAWRRWRLGWVGCWGPRGRRPGVGVAGWTLWVLWGGGERRRLLGDWNATARALAAATLPQLFAAQAAKTPDAVAVVFGDEQLSYGELEGRANQLAHHLRALGVGAESVVGVCLERSL